MKFDAVTGKSVQERLSEKGSARFIARVSLDKAEFAERDINARGVTDFGARETLARQQQLASAVIRDGKLKQAEASSTRDKLIFAAGVWAMERLGGSKEAEYFYSGGRRWRRRGSGEWISMDDRSWGDARHEGDPALIVEALRGVGSLSEVDGGAAAGKDVLHRFRGEVELTSVADALTPFLHLGSDPKKGRDLGGTTPLFVWTDEDKLCRRLAWAPIEPDGPRRLWWSLELFDFGARFERPPVEEA